MTETRNEKAAGVNDRANDNVNIHINIGRALFVVGAVLGLAALIVSAQVAQPKTTEGAAATPLSEERASAGDSPDDPGPIAVDLSPALTHAAISKAAQKVADWQLARAEPIFSQQWT